MNLKENEFLRELAEVSRMSLEFKDEKILPGTAYLNSVPIDITIENNKMILNAVGAFSGDKKSLSKCANRGKGFFKLLYPGIANLINKYGLEEKIYLTPLSPVWERNYNLKETDRPVKGNRFYLDLTT